MNFDNCASNLATFLNDVMKIMSKCSYIYLGEVLYKCEHRWIPRYWHYRRAAKSEDYMIFYKNDNSEIIESFYLKEMKNVQFKIVEKKRIMLTRDVFVQAYILKFKYNKKYFLINLVNKAQMNFWKNYFQEDKLVNSVKKECKDENKVSLAINEKPYRMWNKCNMAADTNLIIKSVLNLDKIKLHNIHTNIKAKTVEKDAEVDYFASKLKKNKNNFILTINIEMEVLNGKINVNNATLEY
ncbi:Large subunit GTPase [Trichinella pseudospiralis]